MIGKAIAVSIMTSALVFAHCDTLDGPVVQAARRALSSGDVSLVLPWVPVQQESTIRQAFRHTQTVRALNSDAQKLADTWFFETLVRVHRAGEGAPYDGLKPAGTGASGKIGLADQAIETGDVDALETTLINHIRQGLRQRFARVLEHKTYDPANVKAGRDYVAGYVDFVHFVERQDQPANAAAEPAHEHVH